MSTLQTYSFAVNKAEIASYGAGGAAAWVAIPVVAESNAEYTIQTAEVTDGEGNLQRIWRHTQRCKVTLRMKRFAFRIVELASGSPVSSWQSTDKIYGGVDQEIDPPYVRLRFHQKAVDAVAGTAGYFEVVIFKAQGHFPALTMREVTPGEYTIVFESLRSSTDDLGNSIPDTMLSVRAIKPTLG